MATQQNSQENGNASVRDIVREEMMRMQASQSGSTSQNQADHSGSPAANEDQIRAVVREEFNRQSRKHSSSGSSQSGSQGSDSSSQKSSQSGKTPSSSGDPTSASQIGDSAKAKKAQVQPKSSGSQSSKETVAQVLTQAQYELSEELQANLHKLRSVIRQSEEIAKKIELVLGHGEKGSGNNE